MRKIWKWTLALVLALGLGVWGFRSARADVAGPCAGSSVTGQVVAVDQATGVITIKMSGGTLCTVTVGSADYDHPVSALLAAYFNQVSPEALGQALEDSQVFVTCTASACSPATAATAGALPAQVTGVTHNADGTYTVTFTYGAAGTIGTFTTTNATLAADLADALDDLNVSWKLQASEGGGPVVMDAGDEISQLREDGLGFGVIVKLYAMAAESQEACAEAAPTATTNPATGASDQAQAACGVTVAELAEQFESGIGMGQLFAEYGKPAMLGVGHVRKALRQMADDAATTEATDDAAVPARCKNNGNGHKPGCSTGTADDSAEPTTQTTVTTNPGNHGGQGVHPGNGNNGNHGGGNSDKGGGKPGKP